MRPRWTVISADSPRFRWDLGDVSAVSQIEAAPPLRYIFAGRCVLNFGAPNFAAAQQLAAAEAGSATTNWCSIMVSYQAC